MKIKQIVKSNMLSYKTDLFIIIFLNIVYLSTSIALPYIVGKYIDILSSKNKDMMIFLLKIFIFLSILEIVSKYFKETLTIKYKLEVSAHINFDTIEHVKRVPLRLLNDENMTYMNKNIAYDSEMSIALIVDFIFSLICKIVTFLVSLFILFRINVVISLIILAFLPLYLGLYHILKKPIYDTFEDFKNTQSTFFATENEQLSKLKLIKISSNFEVFATQIRKVISDLVKSGMKHIKIDSIFSNSGLALNKLALLFLFIYGGFQTLNGNLTIGEFVIINSYFSTLINCMIFFTDFGSSYSNTLVCYDRLEAILSLKKDIIGTKIINSIDTISFNNVSFSYNEENEIFKNFNYKFEKGHIYCLVGENGKGKSTLLDLLIGLKDNYTGDICYDSSELKELDIYNTRKNLIGFTEQEPTLINNTLLNNLVFRTHSNSIDINIINAYAKKLNLDTFINKLDNGLNSIINADSKNISGGEKQKISILRSLLKNPDLLIFDEPTSALDHYSIEEFKKLLYSIKQDKIIIIITHDKYLLDICDEKLDLSSSNFSVNCCM